ncbi:G2/mitotic-specific cyclin [Rhizopus stolonifer]|uniref:G2/mitotic-specific cyclin n=1 Tax=Rhizopus stolonifer TaxID=4846 RepID=A0A367JTA1_RHIST|nr:G2/mitotic-specific cyclin [Rhizopus stolonifer]
MSHAIRERPTQTPEERKNITQATILNSFSKSNELRHEKYPELNISIVPVVPIKAPDSIKSMFQERMFLKQVEEPSRRKDQSAVKAKPYKNMSKQPKALSFHINKNNESTTPFDEKEPQPQNLVSKHIQTESNDKSIEFDKKQELREQDLMPQYKSLHEETQHDDPMAVNEYADEIFERLRIAENNNRPDPDYINKIQCDIAWSTRGVLIDWVIEIHYLFSLLPETLFLTVNIIDRFLSIKKVALPKIQLVGALALFIATKFEERKCPALEDIISTMGNQAEEEEFILAESLLLQALEYRVYYANPMNFLRRFLTEDQGNENHTRLLSKYFMEVCMIDHRTIAIKPSLVAASSICLARTMLGRKKWPTKLMEPSGYSLQDLKPVMEIILDYISQPVIHDALFKKWCSKQFSRVSIFARDWVSKHYVVE